MKCIFLPQEHVYYPLLLPLVLSLEKLLSSDKCVQIRLRKIIPVPMFSYFFNHLPNPKYLQNVEFFSFFSMENSIKKEVSLP